MRSRILELFPTGHTMARFSVEQSGQHVLVTIDLRKRDPLSTDPEEHRSARFDEIVPNALWGDYSEAGHLLGLTVCVHVTDEPVLFNHKVASWLVAELGEDGVRQLRHNYDLVVKTIGTLVPRLRAV